MTHKLIGYARGSTDEVPKLDRLARSFRDAVGSEPISRLELQLGVSVHDPAVSSSVSTTKKSGDSP